ncbi:hypothetical protein B484DRAFT_409424 [Ochromonadaceae sp. CCMP2298]|nr:hypothetical protein B484DRAFT_409424 [Ochromonadaceae sp. CCMP2298]
MRDSDEVSILNKTIKDCRDREHRFRIKLATLDAQVEESTLQAAQLTLSHQEEKRYLYQEMKKSKGASEGDKREGDRIALLNKTLKGELEGLGQQAVGLARAQLQVRTVVVYLYVL